MSMFGVACFQVSVGLANICYVTGGASEAVDAAVLVVVFVMSGLCPGYFSDPAGGFVDHL
jgi:hypothetical protein